VLSIPFEGRPTAPPPAPPDSPEQA
jgi:hypothetical protein